MQALLIALLAVPAAAESVSRGPYFVEMTTTTARVCWRRGKKRSGDDCLSVGPLAPGATFTYSLPGSSGTWDSRLLPAHQDVLRFAAFGDSGQGTKAQYRVARELERWGPDLVLLLGDIVYPQGHDDDYDDKYFKPYARLLPRIPFFPAIGNHDYGNDKGRRAKGERRLRKHYARIHRRPRYYSFDAASVHFVSVDDNGEGFRVPGAASIAEGSEQWNWLDRDLAATKAEWKVVFLHVPLYTSRPHGRHDILRKHLEPLLLKHKVDLVLAGHNHYYERSKPINGVTHVIAGTGGARARSAREESSLSAKILQRNGFLGVQVSSGSMVLEFIGDQGLVEDTCVLRK